MHRAAIVVAIAALLSVLLFVHVPGQGLWYDVSLNASHGPIFAVVAVLLAQARRPAARAVSAVVVDTFFVAVGLGILIEILQTLAHRPGSPFDVMTDAAGAAAGLGLWVLCERRRSRTTGRPSGRESRWPLAVALAGVAFVAWPPLQAARAYAHRAAEFPTLMQFREPHDLTFVTTEGVGVGIVGLPTTWARVVGERALRIGFDAVRGPAVRLEEPSPDWRGYATLAADLTNASAVEVRLTLRVFDARHDWSHQDRLNLPLVLAPHARTAVRVALAEIESAPHGRAMDLGRVADVMLFGKPSSEPGAIYVSRVWLE